MLSDTLTKEDVELLTGFDPTKYSHYIRRKAQLEGMVEGTAAEALCGYIFVPSKDGTNMPVCPQCKAVYDDNEAMAIITD